MKLLAKYHHVIMTALTFFVFCLLYTSLHDESFFYTKSHFMMYTLITSLTFLFFVFIKFSFLDFIFMKFFIIIFSFSSILLGVIYYLYSIKNEKIIVLIHYTNGIIGALVLITSLAIAYKLIIAYLIKLGGTSRIIVELFFFIPCLLSYFIQYLLQQYNSTTNEIIILLFFEILLYVLYFVINCINYENSEKKKVLDHVMFLDRKKIISTPCISLDKNIENSSDGRRVYSISLWISINTDVSNVYSSQLLCYGAHYPLITYEFDHEKKQNVVVFKLGINTVPELTKVYLSPQKWHNIIVTYVGNYVNIYCDGALARKIDIDNNLPVYTLQDTLVIGSDRILNGAIANVDYYTYELTFAEIVTIYNLDNKR